MALSAATIRAINIALGDSFDGDQKKNIIVALESVFDASEAGEIPAARLISTTGPLAGGGDLSADRTLTLTKAPTVAAAAVPFADLTAAANKVNEVIASLKTGNLMA